MHFFHSPRCLEYHAAGHPERPARIQSVIAALNRDTYPQHTWHEPQPCSDADILRVHHADQMAAVASGNYVDADTPHFANIDALARLASGSAIQAAERALDGTRCFSLMRPPGHHAEKNRIMGFCYYNHLAIAVRRLLDAGRLARVAVFDFDCHHGNGTENIFHGDERVRVISLHQSPCYPGTGLVSSANCYNYPLPPGTGPEAFLAACDTALQTVAAFQPELIAVSAGFDAYRHDPITDMNLDVETFHAIGKKLAAQDRATFAVLEGGYADNLGQLVAAFVDGWEHAENSSPAAE